MSIVNEFVMFIRLLHAAAASDCTSVVSISVILAVWWPPVNMATSMHCTTLTLGKVCVWGGENSSPDPLDCLARVIPHSKVDPVDGR